MFRISNKYLWLFIDVVLINIALLLSILVRFGDEFQNYLYLYKENILIISLVYIGFSVIFHLYDCFWRYISIKEVFLLGFTLLISVFISLLVIGWHRDYLFPRTVSFLFLFFNMTFISGNKLLWRFCFENRSALKRGENRILIVGAGDAGDMLSREIIKRPDLGLLVGFVDDDRGKVGKNIHGKKVFGKTGEIGEVIRKNNIDSVIIAIPSASGSDIRKIVDKIPGKGIDIKTLPGIYELVDGKVSYSKVRKLEIADILGREPVNLNMDAISDYLQNKIVLVTGAGGSIGSEISRQICNYHPGSLILLDISENNLYSIFYELKVKWPKLSLTPLLLNITNKIKLKNAFKKIKPDVIFHAAAHKHVPILEYYPEEAVWNNIIGTRNLVELSHQFEAENMIMISTDKAINPTSVMGASKRIAEMILKDLGGKSNTKFSAVRFGNVLDSSGSVIPLFRQQIARGGPVTVTDKEVKRYFMTISEASQLVIQAGVLGDNGQVFLLDMGEPIKIYDLATEMIKLMGFEAEKDIDIKIVGLRPGEKLFEVLMTEEEKSRASTHTAHEKIFIARVGDVDGDKLAKDILELENLALDSKEEKIIEKLQQILPDYKPNRLKEHLQEYQW
ncbi:MAG: polysaccharide biosynthesis protein [Halanaerobiales bacterium]